MNRLHKSKDHILLIGLYAIAILAQYLVKDHAFFWDTVQLASKQAHWYYENEFNHLLLPTVFDSGHPPTFGMYLAVLWQIFGQSLAVSHFAVLPFSLASIFFLKKLGDFFFPSEQIGAFLPLLMLVDPTFAAQNILVSPDTVLMSAFFAGIYAVVKEKKWLLVLAALVLAMISMRGMMVVVVLYVLQIYHNHVAQNRRLTLRLLWQSSLVFVPAGLLALAFLLYHYQQKGWIAYHEDSPWAVSFEKVGWQGFLKNIGLYIWRMLDFGRVFVLLILSVLLIQFRRQWKTDQNFNYLLVLLVASVLLLSPSLLIHKYLLAHRYLLPIYFVCSLGALYLLFRFVARQWQMPIYGLLFLGLLTGNLWIYPPKIAQGWDATLAHLPYYQLATEMLDFIEKEAIPLEQIGSVFPEVGARKYRSLNQVEAGFVQADLAQNEYIFYSNVMNDFSDEDLEALAEDWLVVKTLQAKGVIVVLYRKTNKDDVLRSTGNLEQ